MGRTYPTILSPNSSISVETPVPQPFKINYLIVLVNFSPKIPTSRYFLLFHFITLRLLQIGTTFSPRILHECLVMKIFQWVQVFLICVKEHVVQVSKNKLLFLRIRVHAVIPEIIEIHRHRILFFHSKTIILPPP